MARHILFHCRERGRSCALYHVTEKGQTMLNFFEPGNDNYNGNAELDFAVYESNSPRQALNWLHYNRFSSLIIVSDVIMPIDTEIGLDGLLEGLSELGLPVNMLFVSSETQSKSFVQELVAPQEAFFVTKGSDGWAKLPEALVRHASTIPCRPIPRNRPAHINYMRSVSNEYSADISISTLKTPALATAISPQTPPLTPATYRQNRNLDNPQVTVSNSISQSAAVAEDSQYTEPLNLPKISFWSRLMRFLRG